MADFHLAIGTVLRHEGGYCNDAADCGGETKYGICKRSYPQLDIGKLTMEEAAAIYERDFWRPLRLSEIGSQEVATKVLDSAVLIGKSRAVKFLQRAVQKAGGGIVPVDGGMGPQTVAAVNGASAELLLASYRQLLATYYEGLVSAVPSDGKFLKGWLTRAES